MTFFSFNVLNVNSLECVSMNNQDCKIRSEMINVNTNESMFYPYSIKINKCKDSCHTVNGPYAKLCVQDGAKNINVEVLNLMTSTDETRHIERHTACKCKCRLDASVCNKKQRWNEDKCRWECKELIDKGICDKRFIWSPTNCECGCDKNCKCRNKLVDKLVEECSENIDRNKILHLETLDVIPLNDYKKICNSCTIYIVLFAVFFITSICISSVFIHFQYYL